MVSNGKVKNWPKRKRWVRSRCCKDDLKILGMLSPFIFKEYPDESMWQKWPSLCSRSVWGAGGEARSNQQSLISLLIKTRSKLNSISSTEYCMIVELRSCLSLFGKGQPCAIVSWPTCFQALEETVCTQPRLLPQGGVVLFVYLGFVLFLKSS